jgi:hypothetical protein
MSKEDPRRPPPPLTGRELQELNRTVKSSLGRRLLWEVHRLRAILLRADQLEILMRDERRWIDDPEINKALDALRADLNRESVVQEDREKRDELLQRRKGLRF